MYAPLSLNPKPSLLSYRWCVIVGCILAMTTDQQGGGIPMSTRKRAVDESANQVGERDFLVG